MITKTVKIGDKDVKFACSAGTLLRYRLDFDEDLLMEMQRLTGNNPDMDVLTKLAYTMAKQAAGGEFPELYEWMDEFEMIDFMQALPEITAIWGQNNITKSESKKK